MEVGKIRILGRAVRTINEGLGDWWFPIMRSLEKNRLCLVKKAFSMMATSSGGFPFRSYPSTETMPSLTAPELLRSNSKSQSLFVFICTVHVSQEIKRLGCPFKTSKVVNQNAGAVSRITSQTFK
jgi:hypothetical protein